MSPAQVCVRERINWPTMEPRDCAAKFIEQSRNGVVAAVFGPEQAGLSNSDLDHCDTLLTIPTDPDFSSLNLAMAVQVFTYELRMAGAQDQAPSYEHDAPLATSEELEHFYAHLERVLTDLQFLNPDNPRHLMRRLRRLYVRAQVDKERGQYPARHADRNRQRPAQRVMTSDDRLIYLDYAATTPVDPRVIETMSALSGEGADFANPSAVHAAGRRSGTHVARGGDAAGVVAEYAARPVSCGPRVRQNPITWQSWAPRATANTAAST